MKKDILFLCQFSYPEHNSSATLPFDTAAYLVEKGWKVDVLCGYPKEYNTFGKVPMREKVKGVNIQRIPYIQLKRASKIGRLVNYFSFTMSSLFHLIKLKNYKTVMVYSNPPVLPLVAVLARKLFHTKFVFVAYDVYPEVAYASRSIQKGDMIDRVMRWINGSLYKNVSKVVSLTDEMKEFLLKHRKHITSRQITTIPNWAHEGQIKVNDQAYTNFGYQKDHFIVSYFGNMGICQEMNTLLDAMEELKDDERIRFLIVGHGSKKPYVEERTRNLPNVQILDFLTGKEFEQAVAISSACVVSLEKGLMGTCAPSKFYSYLQGGHPVLGIVEKESYLFKEIQEEKLGYAVEIGQTKYLVSAIRKMSENPQECSQMGSRAKDLYDHKYRKEICLEQYHRMLQTILEK